MLPAMLLMQLASSGLNSIGAFYDAKTQKYGLLSAAQQAEFAAQVSSLNARRGEKDAQATLEAGQKAAGLRQLQGADQRAAVATQTAAAGVVGGTGNAAEVQASMRYAQEADVGVLSANAVRAAWDRRIESTNDQNAARMAMTQAAHLRRTAKKVSPWMSAAATALGGASQVASRWIYTGPGSE